MIFNMIASGGGGGGGASAPRFGIATSRPYGPLSSSLSFTNLLGEPQAFCVINVPIGANTSMVMDISSYTRMYYITHFVYDGVEISTAASGNNGSKSELCVYGNGYNAENNVYSFVYSSGTLTLSINPETSTPSSGVFDFQMKGQYELLYIY